VVNDIEKRLAYAAKKAKERNIKAANIKTKMLKWPEFSTFHDIYVYVGGDTRCGFLLILATDNQVTNYERSSEKIKFEEKFLNLTSSVLGKEVNKLEPMIEYDSQENLDKNYGGSIARRLAD